MTYHVDYVSITHEQNIRSAMAIVGRHALNQHGRSTPSRVFRAGEMLGDTNGTFCAATHPTIDAERRCSGCAVRGRHGHAETLEGLTERIDRLEQENRELRQEIDALKAGRRGRYRMPLSRSRRAPPRNSCMSIRSTATRFSIRPPTSTASSASSSTAGRTAPSLPTGCTSMERSLRSPTTSRAVGTTSSDT